MINTKDHTFLNENNPFCAPEDVDEEYRVPQEEGRRPEVLVPTRVKLRELLGVFLKILKKEYLKLGKFVLYPAIILQLFYFAQNLMCYYCEEYSESHYSESRYIFSTMILVCAVSFLANIPAVITLSVGVIRNYTALLRGEKEKEKIFRCTINDVWRVFMYLSGVILVVILPMIIALIMMAVFLEIVVLKSAFFAGLKFELVMKIFLCVSAGVVSYFLFRSIPGFWLVMDRQFISPWQAFCLSFQVTRPNFFAWIPIIITAFALFGCLLWPLWQIMIYEISILAEDIWGMSVIFSMISCAAACVFTVPLVLLLVCFSMMASGEKINDYNKE
ncbi:MAG: hypothetical protein Q4C96_05980 [Planctomycetia bacterium]|nr:hypothetical protein [Planctomycetia bacterium]